MLNDFNVYIIYLFIYTKLFLVDVKQYYGLWNILLYLVCQIHIIISYKLRSILFFLKS